MRMVKLDDPYQITLLLSAMLVFVLLALGVSSVIGMQFVDSDIEKLCTSQMSSLTEREECVEFLNQYSFEPSESEALRFCRNKVGNLEELKKCLQ